jgi:HK97 family phage major capsid protein
VINLLGDKKMTVLELRELAVEKAEEARAIKDKATEESRGLTSEEGKIFDELLKESERLEGEANRQERLETAEARLSAPRQRATRNEQANGRIIEPPKPHLFRYGTLRAFKGPTAEADAYKSGRWLLAVIHNHAPSRQWCHEHGVEIVRDLTPPADSRAVQVEGINTLGGFIVPTEMERAIIDLRETYGNARANCRIHPMSTDHTTIPRRAGGVTAYFIGETTEITESEKSWNQVELTAKKLGALTRMSTDLSEDAIINVADDLADEMAYAFAVKEDECCIDGDGTSTYGGIVGIRTKMIDGNHLGSYVEAAAPGDNWSEIDTSDLTNVMAALPKYARRNAKWHCSPLAKVAVFDRLLLAAGGNTNQNLAQNQPAMYSGYPIEEWPAMPTDDSSAALNAVIMLFFGDMRFSTTLGDRRSITVKVSDQRYIEFDQIGIQATERFTINNHDIGGSTATSRGPIVGLLGNT